MFEQNSAQQNGARVDEQDSGISQQQAVHLEDVNLSQEGFDTPSLPALWLGQDEMASLIDGFNVD